MFTLVQNYKRIFLLLIGNEFAGEGSESTSITADDFNGETSSDLAALKKALADGKIDSDEAKIIAEQAENITEEAQKGLKKIASTMLKDGFLAKNSVSYNAFKNLLAKTDNIIPGWDSINKALKDNVIFYNRYFIQGVTIKDNNIYINYTGFGPKNTLKLNFSGDTIDNNGTWEEYKGEKTDVENASKIDVKLLDEKTQEKTQEKTKLSLDQQDKEIEKYKFQIAEGSNFKLAIIIADINKNLNSFSEENQIILNNLMSSISNESLEQLLNSKEEKELDVLIAIVNQHYDVTNPIIIEAKNILDASDFKRSKTNLDKINELLLRYNNKRAANPVQKTAPAATPVQKTAPAATPVQKTTPAKNATSKKSPEKKDKSNPKEHFNKKSETERKEIQKLLGVKEDGKIGPKTLTAIIDFQTKNNLEKDGKVGKLTLAKLRSSVSDSGNKSEVSDDEDIIFNPIVQLENKDTQVEKKDSTDESITEGVSEKFNKVKEWIKELFSSDVELNSFIGENGFEVMLEYNEKSNKISMDTSRSDKIGDFELTNVPKDIDTIVEAKKYVTDKISEMKKIYDDKVMDKAIKSVNEEGYENSYSNIGNFEIDGKIVKIKLDKNFGGPYVSVNSPYGDGISDSEALEKIIGEVTPENIKIAAKIVEIKYRKLYEERNKKSIEK